MLTDNAHAHTTFGYSLSSDKSTLDTHNKCNTNCAEKKLTFKAR